MIRDLDDTLMVLLKARAPPGSLLAGADISFELPDAAWRGALSRLTANCYLYAVRENRAMRTAEMLTARTADGTRASRVQPPVRIDCAYCITAWSIATTDPALEEHDLLSQILSILLRAPVIPKALLQGVLVSQIAPYPTIIASEDNGRNQPEFWTALEQKLKPSLNYVITLAFMIEDVPADAQIMPAVSTVHVNADDESLAPST